MIDVWINCPDRDTARAIARELVSARLAACANVFGEIESVYRWDGAIEEAREVVLLVKTRAGLFEALCDAVRRLHPYEVPAIHAVKAAAVLPAYAGWLEAETAEASGTP